MIKTIKIPEKIIINVGTEDLSGSIAENDFAVLIYTYENYGYEGSGQALVKDRKGLWVMSGLGHCSCNSPEEGIDYTGQFKLDDLEEAYKKREGEYDKAQYEKLLKAMFKAAKKYK